MKDRIVIEGEPGEYYLQWFFADEHETVAIALEVRTAAVPTGGVRCARHNSLLRDAFVWERRADATAALKLIKAAVAARKANQPVP